MPRCFIFAAGDFYGLRARPEPGDLVIAADAGLLACRQAGIVPTLANLQCLLFLRRRGARGWMYGEDFLWTVIENESLTVRKTVEWGLFSAFCLGDRAEGVDESGVQYPLSNAVLTPEFPLGVSNHIVEPSARVSVRRGALAVGWELPPLA